MADVRNRYDRYTGPRERKLRAGDEERDAVADILRREHVKGRLDAVEFQERLDRCLVAKTYGDLDELVADLPGDAPRRRRRMFGWMPRPWPVGLVPLVVLALVFASHGHVLWIVFPLFFLFVLRPLVWRPWRE